MNQDDVIRMAREAECSETWGGDAFKFTVEELEHFAALVAAAEREACAKLVEGINPDHQDCNHYDRYIAAAIRARGNK